MIEKVSTQRKFSLTDVKYRYYMVAALLFLGAIIIYYFGEIENYFNFNYLHWSAFYAEHDFQRLLFLIPIIYTSHHFRLEGVILSTLVTSSALLPRALLISRFPDSLMRTSIFIVLSAGIGLLYTLLYEEHKKAKKFQVKVDERDRFKTMLEKLDEGILIIGPDYKVRFCNSRMKREFGDGVGSYCYDYLPEQVKPCEQQPCRFLRVMKDDTCKWEYIFKNGRAFETIASLFVDSDGETCQLTAIREITQQKRNETELLGLSNLKSDILSNLSHELRNPLTSLKGIVTGLLRQDVKFDQKTQRQLFFTMLEETERLDNMVADLLEMSKLEAGIWKPKRKAFDVSEMINDVITKEQRIHSKHAIITEIEPDLPELHAVYGHIVQVLMNLIDNAANYSNPGTEIIIKARKADQMLEVTVSDEGKGIDPLDIKNIFQRFYRGNQNDQGRGEIKGSLGLGLAICQSIVLSHKGRIWAESSVGTGSVFHFTLPFLSENEG